MTPEEAFLEYWKEKNGGVVPDQEELARVNIFLKGPEFLRILQETFIAGRQSKDLAIQPEWAAEIVHMHKSNSSFWTSQELSRLFQLPESEIKEILDADKNPARQ